MASISVLLLTSDSDYGSRLGQYLSRHHTDIRLSIIDSARDINRVLAVNSFSVILMETEFSELSLSLPGRTICAYLSPSDAMDKLGDRKVFCKYRSGETIYRVILDLFSEVSSNAAVSDKAGTVCAFVGANGGAGASTLAGAYAKRLAASGVKTLYINLDKFFDSSALFSGESIGNMSDLFFAVVSSERSRGGVNLSAKAQALMCRDSSGVSFIKSCNNPYEFNDNTEERMNAVYSAMLGDPPYDAVVLDIPAHNDIAWELMLAKAGRIFAVTENKPSAELKLSGFIKLLKACESHSPGILAKTSLIMNRDVTRDWAAEQRDDVPFLGGVPRYNDNDAQSIMNAIMRLEMWNKL